MKPNKGRNPFSFGSAFRGQALPVPLRENNRSKR